MLNAFSIKLTSSLWLPEDWTGSIVFSEWNPNILMQINKRFTLGDAKVQIYSTFAVLHAEYISPSDSESKINRNIKTLCCVSWTSCSPWHINAYIQVPSLADELSVWGLWSRFTAPVRCWWAALYKALPLQTMPGNSAYFLGGWRMERGLISARQRLILKFSQSGRKTDANTDAM